MEIKQWIVVFNDGDYSCFHKYPSAYDRKQWKHSYKNDPVKPIAVIGLNVYVKPSSGYIRDLDRGHFEEIELL